MMSEEHKFSNGKRCKVQDWLSKLLWEPALLEGGDIRLMVVGHNDLRVSMEVWKSVLAEKSRFFAEKFCCDGAMSHSVEINDCDDVEVYVEVVVLMHYEDLKARLCSMNDGVPKVSTIIMFDPVVVSCLEYLESIPWSENE
ncbi:BTB/POZ domain-containing protein [Vigna angularis]|uniref:BTB/POZ domain-containing protein n=1 Tax=Phaseolus angularis TaxID=3914 RepID=A0A8T0JQK9_PHAAN|nr:BTB/POZ domain-containing protein [Vigna angularis]